MLHLFFWLMQKPEKTSLLENVAERGCACKRAKEFIPNPCWSRQSLIAYLKHVLLKQLLPMPWFLKMANFRFSLNMNYLEIFEKWSVQYWIEGLQLFFFPNQNICNIFLLHLYPNLGDPNLNPWTSPGFLVFLQLLCTVLDTYCKR